MDLEGMNQRVLTLNPRKMFLKMIAVQGNDLTTSPTPVSSGSYLKPIPLLMDMKHVCWKISLDIRL
jgi:hypothetical protein